MSTAPLLSRMSKRRIYWLLQILGWQSIVVIEVINYTFFIQKEFHWYYFLSFGSLSLIGILSTHFYRKWFIKPVLFEQSRSRIFTKGIQDVLIISTIMALVSLLPDANTNLSSLLTYGWEALVLIGGQIMNIARYVVVWIIIYYMYKIMERNQAILQEKLDAEKLARTSELELLKSQLNPHFLFNALNSIKALVLLDAEKSRDAIIKLSELLRFSLNYEKNRFITIREELEEVEKYLALEKIRFGERLNVTFEIQSEVWDKPIPPAILLTLAENAIKHGINQLPDGGNIDIDARIEENNVIIAIENSGFLSGPNPNGIGLQNIQKRLKNLYPTGASLTLQNTDENKVIAQLIYPIEQ